MAEVGTLTPSQAFFLAIYQETSGGKNITVVLCSEKYITSVRS